jgi:alanine dehydrogenase
MRIGIPKEIKDHEYRVAITPAGVRALVQAGHRVLVERNAGLAIGLEDAAYQAAGADMTDTEGAYAADLVQGEGTPAGGIGLAADCPACPGCPPPGW